MNFSRLLNTQDKSQTLPTLGTFPSGLPANPITSMYAALMSLLVAIAEMVPQVGGSCQTLFHTSAVIQAKTKLPNSTWFCFSFLGDVALVLPRYSLIMLTCPISIWFQWSCLSAPPCFTVLMQLDCRYSQLFQSSNKKFASVAWEIQFWK